MHAQQGECSVKRVLSFILFFTLLSIGGIMLVSCSAETPPREGIDYFVGEDGLYYNVWTGGYAVSIGNRKTDICDIVIPSEFRGEPVIAIESFRDSQITSISIPSTVTRISQEPFFRCRRLQNIIVDENNAVFSSLDGNLYNKEQTELIRYSIGKTETSFDIPETVTIIEKQTFERAQKLTSLVIPDNVTIIKQEAFLYCTNLTSVFIPSSVVTIEENVFLGCKNLTIKCEAESMPSTWSQYWSLKAGEDKHAPLWGQAK
jgi:hypothetical protein